jgi:hypothetical protein
MWLAEQGWTATAVDFSDVALAKAKRLAAARGVSVEWVLNDVLEYRPLLRSFELVAVLYLQLRAEELGIVLAAAAEAIAPGGTLVVLGHDTTNLTAGYGGPKDAAVLFTPEDVLPRLGDLVVECAEKVERTVARDDGDRVAIDALVRARRPV